MKKYISIILILIGLSGYAQIPNGYYDAAQGLSGYQLKTALKSIISNGHQDHGYDALYTAYQTTDVDNYYEHNGTVLDMYSERPNGADAYEYTHNSNHCGTYHQEGDCFNREHIMPQSVFHRARPMRTDAHFVVPTDGYVNNRRSSYAFGEVSSPSWTSSNGSKLGSNTTSGYNGTVFEPIDEFKGDIARMLFYFATRYENQVAGWNHAMLNGTSDQVYETWFLDILLQWCANDPVSQREIDRNNAVYNYQHNRNPFIDHPEWVNLIWNPTPDTQAPTTPSNLVASNITANSVNLSWNASSDNVGVIGYDIYMNGSLKGTSTSTNYNATGLTPSTSYSCYVVARDAAANVSAHSNTINITTLAGVSYILNEDFNDCNSVGNNFTAYNEASNKDWTCSNQYGYNNTGCMQMNGYQEDVSSKDWLITTNPIHFDQYTNEKLSVYFKYKYGSTPLELLYSSNYNGSGNPANATWHSVPNITINAPSGSTEGTQTITNANISSINGTAYLAFKYYSNGDPTRWTVDNFSISGDNSSNINDPIKTAIKIYPNPGHFGFINIKFNTDIKIFKIQLYTLAGQKLMNFQKIQSGQRIKLKGLSKGIYMLHLSTNKAIVIKKIIVE